MIVQQATDRVLEQTAGTIIALPISFSAILVGADPVGLLLGLLAAVMMTFMVGGVDNKWKAVMGILFATLIAGYAAPVIIAGILYQWPKWKHILDLAHPLISLFLGAASPTIIPAFLKGLVRRAERLGGGE